ncbi:hypothetical protein A3B60_01755 [Candidatus Peregrinibacteria bacterium RIFCSPLOWO2_01_FULL_39_12]|nr:MAG: hypothetical protein A3I58_01910 [Candidatus Peregrinibacteria bacterium RIFCSPLOWO2_02_FULL_39_10]OGJ43153.1 MAG: hypothetical protein A3B60_01755 [Candidatus Peregrinibacteria bacterium RIFCSPLOWO2_01_FULL_39_12]
MFRPDDLSRTERSTEDTPVAGSPHDPTTARKREVPQQPLSARARRNGNVRKGFLAGGLGTLAASGAFLALTVDRGPQSPSDGIELTDPTLRAIYSCTREAFYLRSNQDLADSYQWFDKNCLNGSDERVRDAMGRIDESPEPLDTIVRIRDAALLEAGIPGNGEDSRPNLVSWVSHPTNIDSSKPVTVMEITDTEKARLAAEEGTLILTYATNK